MLQLVHSGRPCPITQSTEAYVVSQRDRHGRRLQNVIAKESGLIFVDPVPFENTEKFYKTEYRKQYKGAHKPKPKHSYRAGAVALKRFQSIQSILTDQANILDAGSSSGEFVYLLKSKGYCAQGVEANEPYANYSRAELDIPVSVQAFSEFSSSASFDLNTMFHVLEHLEHPVRDLAHLASFLKPSGYFVIEVPNILYPNMAFNNKWHAGHLFSYQTETLQALVTQAGLNPVSCGPIEDGGNLFAIFRKEPVSHDPLFVHAEQTIQTLRDQQIQYYWNIQNYFKPFQKLRRWITESSKTKNLATKDILDLVYFHT